MGATIIQKRSDANVLRAKEIRDGKNKDFVFCEGEKNMEELLKSKWAPSAVFCRSDTSTKIKTMLGRHGMSATPTYILSESVMSFLSDLETPPGFIALSKRTPQARKSHSPTTNALILVLHGVQLPQNIGGLMRTAEAAGASEVWLTENTADAFSPKAIRGSSGSVFRVSIRQGMSFSSVVEELKQQKISFCAADQNGVVDYDRFDWMRPVALLMGAEGPGLSAVDLKKVPHTVKIPMQGANESLNVGVAAAVCLFEAARQRRLRGSEL